ncbi:hypothetical protein [Hymenobacter sp. BT559]|uniref:hypothetical protein n=1 Tax=Hymenobacter sp. BT559 TaxID=2795729 RepID=UPI0018EBE933|nr:hypothetical protein [Hymenobacter sp. BT559]MBJ6145630.1 hypothetical protein [Hymenobacter sp. BT559]
MKKILCSIPGLLLLLALAGCCANDICVCADTGLADALQFKFNYTTHRQVSGGKFVSFNASDVDTLRIYRTSLNPSKLPNFVATTDSVTIGRPLYINAKGDTLISDTLRVTSANGETNKIGRQNIVVINNSTPFPASGGNKLDAYTYRISLIRNRSGNRKPTYSYYLTNIFIAGEDEANGCCTCYRNTGKAFTLGIGNPANTTRVTVVAYDTASIKELTRLPRPR